MVLRGGTFQQNSGDEQLPTRLWIGVMIFLTTYSAFTIRVNMSLLIISMVTEKGQEIPECLLGLNKTWRDDNEFKVLEFEDLATRGSKEMPDYGPRYDWDQNTQGLILSGYFYAFVISAFIGGKLASWLGPVKVIFWTQLISAFINSAIPLLAGVHFSVVVALRLILGFGGGFIYPSLHFLISRWAPPDEKGKFMAATMGNNFGTCVTWYLVGEITQACGWQWGFHFVSLQNIIFCAIFYLVCSDSPDSHLWISDLEKEYIKRSQAGSVSNEKQATPWKDILTSKALWILAITHFCDEWGVYLQMTGVPKFMAEVIGFNLIESGILAGVPHLMRMFVGMSVSYISDIMFSRGVSHSFSRRFFACFSHVAPGLLMVSISFIGCHWDHIVVLLIFSMAFNGCSVVVNQRNAQDLSPNHAGVVYSLTSAVGGLAGVIVPAVTGAFIEEKNGIEQWEWIFRIGGAIYVAGAIVFILFGSAKQQPWNDKQPDGEA